MKRGTPSLVAEAFSRCQSAGLPSCHRDVGQMLAVLAAHLRHGARVLELGTSGGVGTAWIASGLLSRTDVSVVTVERDTRIANIAACVGFPSFVDMRTGDSLALLAEADRYDLIFADAPRGKWDGLELTINALAPAGMLVVDDMNPIHGISGEHRDKLDFVRSTLMNCPLLLSIEMRLGSGIILSTRHRKGGLA